jgi:hypothetical protein
MGGRWAEGESVWDKYMQRKIVPVIEAAEVRSPVRVLGPVCRVSADGTVTAGPRADGNRWTQPYLPARPAEWGELRHHRWWRGRARDALGSCRELLDV